MATPWTPPHGWWDDYPADEKETSMKCECDFDCVGDPAHYVRSNHSTLCLIHDKCQVCDERLAVITDHGTKLCRACAEEEFIACPNCGNDADFAECSAVGREPHGETHEDVWLVCRHCGKRTDDEEVKAYNAARQAAINRQLEVLAR